MIYGAPAEKNADEALKEADFVKGIAEAVSQITEVFLFFIPVVGGLVLVVMGLMLMKADGHGAEIKQIKDRMGYVLGGTALGFGGTWLINWLSELVKTGGGS